MAKRRILKKNISYICSELFMECVALTHYKVNADKEKVDNLMGRILGLHDEFIQRANHTEPGNVKGFYKKLRTDFNAEVDDIANAINQLC